MISNDSAAEVLPLEGTVLIEKRNSALDKQPGFVDTGELTDFSRSFCLT